MKKVAFLVSVILTVGVLFVWVSGAQAYMFYSDDSGAVGDGTQNCAACHGEFRAGTYIPLSGAPPWAGTLHQGHLDNTTIGDSCDNCHGGVGSIQRGTNLSSSGDAADGVNFLSCSGCHEPTGLRAHHAVNGITSCSSGCHPSDPPPPPENIAPPWYGSITNLITGTNLEPCNLNGEENFESDPSGLDNDGDNLYDGDDPDCAAGVCGDGTIDAGEDCDDGNTAPGDCCAADCTFEASGSPCGDQGVECLVDDTCDGAGACTDNGNEPDGTACGDPANTECDNPDSCLAGACDPNNEPAGTACGDQGVECLVDDSCDGAGACTDNGLAPDGTPCGDPTDTNCDNPDSCLAGGCEPNTETAGTPCPDGEYCNGDETCDGGGICLAGTDVICDDGVGCTDDICDEAADACVYIPNNALCPDDGLFCNGTEFCDPVNDCSSTGDPCPPDVCNEVTDTCDPPTGVCGDGILDPDEECDDGTANGDTTCGCQLDCTYTLAGTPCPDGEYCNGDETCDGGGTCQPGTPVVCDDGVGCTDDVCDEANDACVYTPNDGNCPDDGLFCNGTEFCDPVNDCSSTGDPCPEGTTCNEDTDTCDEPTGVCGDGIIDPNEVCDDGAANNGTTTCGCQLDCTYTAAGTPCPDGEYCNGDETCDGGGTCQPGAPVVCDDGVGCTDDTCDEVADACVSTPNDANCPDDGLFCNGTEYCDPVNDCSSTGDPCPPGTTCDEVNDQCVQEDGDAWLDQLRAPNKLRLTDKKQQVMIDVTAKGNSSVDQLVTVNLTGDATDAVKVHVNVTNTPVTQFVLSGDGRTSFEFMVDMKCNQLDGSSHSVAWEATIVAAEQNSDPSNDTVYGTTRVVCASGGGGGPPSDPEICDDGIDNDGDGKVDCDDRGDCKRDPACQ